MKYQNHLIDPTFFFDAIEEFSFNYTIHVFNESDDVDDYGRRMNSYTKKLIRGSLQTHGKQEHQSTTGNTTSNVYMFYCKSLYQINIGDIIEYDGDYLRVNSVHPYNEFGVREATLEMIKLNSYRDFADYIKYLNGEKLI